MNAKIDALREAMQNERREKNQELLEILTDLINKADGHLRFSQLLAGYGFVKDTTISYPMASALSAKIWENEFYTEPREVLERVLQELNRIES